MATLLKEGTLQQIWLPEYLYDLSASGKGGTLRFEQDALIKVLYLSESCVAYASSNAETDRLGEVLIRNGKLTREEFTLASSKLEGGKTLGKQLIEMGFVRPEELLEGAKAQVEGIVVSLFAWKTASFTWMEGKLPDGLVNLKLSTLGLILSGVMSLKDRQDVMERLGGESAVYNFSPDFMERYEKMNLPESADTLIAGIDGKRNVGQLAKLGKGGEFEACQILYFCKSCRLINSLTSAPSETQSGADDFATIKTSAPPPTAPAAPPSETASPSPSAPPPSPVNAKISHSGKDEESSSINLQLTHTPPSSPQNKDLQVQLQTPPEPDELGMDSPASALFNTAIPKESLPKSHKGAKILMGLGAILLLGAGLTGARYWYRIHHPGAFHETVAEGLAKGKAVFFTQSPRKDEAGSSASTKPPIESPIKPGQTEPADKDHSLLPSEALPSKPDTGTVQSFTLPSSAKNPSSKKSAPTPKVTPSPNPQAVHKAAPAKPPVKSTPKKTKAKASPSSGLSAATARRAIQEGQISTAAKNFRTSLSKVPGSRYTVQLELVCAEKSIRKSYSASDGSEQWFFVPTSFHGRSCWRICWGLFKSSADARRARGKLPSYYRGQEHRTQIVRVSSLR